MDLKENRALTRRLQLAKFKERGLIEDIDYQHPRGLDRRLMRTLASSDWVRQHQNLLLIGPTGIGKNLAYEPARWPIRSCRDGFFAVHKRMAELFRDLAVARADGSIEPSAGETGAHRCAGARRLRHGTHEGQRAARLSGNL